jgi:NADH-quinone oxidoreductase subunit L
MSYEKMIYLVPLLPMLSFILLGLFGRHSLRRAAGFIGTTVLLVITLISLYTALQYFQQDGTLPTIIPYNFKWLEFTESLSIDMGIVLDPISVMMLVVICVVSLMVHVFSQGYMKGEERIGTYYAFLSLFTFSMLGLVLASNIFQIYVFWELVGVSSYLLIGFYFNKPAAVAASKKAFIVTRFADLAFLVGILILGFEANSFDFSLITQRLTSADAPELISIAGASFLGISVLTWALTLIFIGGAGKSAMFPLHIWLPDAMEGPTPVSALIHAATMVVAGVYLVARLFPIFHINETSLQIVTWVGAISSIFAAIIACTQTDIKRVLAYSTMSQIGYMMFALGVSGYGSEAGLGYTASMFHLFTHAFFKSLLFLGAGAVIHYIHSNEMGDMGGLRKWMPLTHICFLIACLAIAGIPPFAGFFSKEMILYAAWQKAPAIFYIGLITSALTAFYMFRLYFSIFWNKPAPSKEIHTHHGEGTWSMKIPLVILATLSIVAGFVPFSRFVTADKTPFDTEFHLEFAVVPVLLAIAGIGLAWSLYARQSGKAEKLARTFNGIYRAAYRKFYIDELYLFITKKVIFNLVARPAAWIDRNIVDGAVNGVARGTAKISYAIRGIQSGKVQSYALYFFAGIACLVVIFVYLWK